MRVKIGAERLRLNILRWPNIFDGLYSIDYNVNPYKVRHRRMPIPAHTCTFIKRFSQPNLSKTYHK